MFVTAALVVILGALWNVPRPWGPVTQQPPSGYSAPMKVGDTIVEGSIGLRWAWDEVEAVTVTRVEARFDRGAGIVELLDDHYVAGSDRTLSGYSGARVDEPWPPSNVKFGTARLITDSGVELEGKPEPFGDWSILAGFKAVQPGNGLLEALRIHYRKGGTEYYIDQPIIVYFCVGETEAPPIDECALSDDEIDAFVEKYS